VVTNGRTPLLRRSRVTANTCGNRSVAVVIVDNDSRTHWAALLTLTAGLTITAAGVALSAAAGATGTALTATTTAATATTGLREGDSGITCGCAQNQRAGNETGPEYPNSAT